MGLGNLFQLLRTCRYPLVAMLSATIGSTIATAQPAPMRVAIVGLEHGHVEGILQQLPKRKDVQLVGIVEPDQALVGKYQQKYSLPPDLFYSQIGQMIDARHPQALLVYTSIRGHRAAIETAAKHGVSVMVEKPLTISLDDALAIRKIARQHHIQVLVNYETTWYASNQAAYNEVERGRLGPIRRVVVHDGHQGPKEIGVSPEFLRWLTDPAQNGAGALYDFGCYGVDLMTWLMHGETPTTVTAIATQAKPNLYPLVDDDSTIVLTYPHSQAVIQGSWNWPFARKDMEIYGATGTAITVGLNHIRLRHEHDREEREIVAPPLPAPQNDPLTYLAAVLRTDLTPKGDLTALDTNIVVMQILDAARESVRTGKSVHLKPIPE